VFASAWRWGFSWVWRIDNLIVNHPRSHKAMFNISGYLRGSLCIRFIANRSRTHLEGLGPGTHDGRRPRVAERIQTHTPTSSRAAIMSFRKSTSRRLKEKNMAS